MQKLIHNALYETLLLTVSDYTKVNKNSTCMSLS